MELSDRFSKTSGTVPQQEDTLLLAIKQKRYTDAISLLPKSTTEEIVHATENKPHISKLSLTEPELVEYISFLDALQTYTATLAPVELNEDIIYEVYLARKKYAETYNNSPSALGGIQVSPPVSSLTEYLLNNNAIVAAQQGDLDQLYTLIKYELPNTHYGKVVYYNQIETAIKGEDHPLTKDVLETIRMGRTAIGE